MANSYEDLLQKAVKKIEEREQKANVLNRLPAILREAFIEELGVPPEFCSVVSRDPYQDIFGTDTFKVQEEKFIEFEIRVLFKPNKEEIEMVVRYRASISNGRYKVYLGDGTFGEIPYAPILDKSKLKPLIDLASETIADAISKIQ